MMRIQSQFLVVDSRRILTNAQIVVHHGRIVALHETPQVQPDLRLDGTVLLPGFINAHTHLEFSDLPHPLPPGENFPAWIASVVRRRRSEAASLSVTELETQRRRAIQMGLEECRRCGTALLVDVVTQPWCSDWLQVDREKVGDSRHQETGVMALAEVLGLDSQRLVDSAQWALQLPVIQRNQEESSRWMEMGVSPHATYSVMFPRVKEELSKVPADRLMAMHVAESLEERQWLEQASGPFRTFFESVGLPVDQRRMQVGEAIDWLASHPRSLLIHGNYLNQDELNTLANSSIAMVYCPRTHQHFKHRHYPLHDVIRRDIPLLLGTDSKASNPDLCIWNECKAALKQHPDWTASAALDAITNCAANVLGVEADMGSLDEGKIAWLNKIPAPPAATSSNLLELLLSQPCPHQPQRLEFENLPLWDSRQA